MSQTLLQEMSITATSRRWRSKELSWTPSPVIAVFEAVAVACRGGRAAGEAAA